MVTSLNWRLRTYSLASGVNSSPGAGRVGPYSRYANRAIPINTTPAPMYTGKEIFFRGSRVACMLMATDGHLTNKNCGGRNRSAKIQVRTDFANIHEHLFQIPRDGDL